MFTRLLINAVAFYVAAYLLPGFSITGWSALFIISIVWGILTLVFKPILLLLTLPINILTLGLFTFVINALLLMLMSRFVTGFSIDKFTTALLAAIVLSLVNTILSRV